MRPSSMPSMSVQRPGSWPPRLLQIVAKTDRQSELTLSLPAHLTDTMEVSEALWEGFLPRSVKDSLVAAAGSAEAAIALVRFVAGTHDVGKCSDAFQRSLPPWSTSRLAQHGLALSSIQQKIPHGTLGQIALKAWLLIEYGEGPGAGHLGEVIGGHHGLNPSPGDLGRVVVENLPLERSVWGDLRGEILAEMADRSGARPYLPDWVANGFPLSIRVLLQAVVILADWIASGSDLFPYQDDRSSVERASDALAALALIPPWVPNPSHGIVELFEQRFPSLNGAAPNPLQVVAGQAAEALTRPGLMLIEARPGMGKTEAGLLAAEVLAARFGNGGIFVGLPTMATANPMFLRVADWLRTMGEQVNSVNLAHGKAALNDDFSRLIRATRDPVVYGESKDAAADSVRVVSWLRGRKRNLLANSVVGTIDQFLMGGLKAKHVVLRHLALAGKVVLLDEIHAADDYMREYALAMLEWLGRYGTPVILMSATLPPTQRRQYLAAYAKGMGGDLPPLDDSPSYPRITTFDGALGQPEVPSDDRHLQVELRQLSEDDQALVELLRHSLAEGGCAAVIRNTVGRAQATYELLAGEFGADVMLLHSRFIAPHRIHRESELTRALGRGGDRPHRLIVVGTQVLEQSLDVDFDLMVTDLAPIDLVLQRVGRLHRHPRPNRPASVREPRLYLSGADWSQELPVPVRGSVSVYGLAKLLRTAAVLAGPFERARLDLPGEIPVLVERGYAADLKAPTGWEACWTEADSQERVRTQKARERARAFTVGEPTDEASMSTWLLAPAEDPETPGQLGKAQVRDGGDSVEVIVLQRDADRVLRLPLGPGPMAGSAISEFLPIDDWRLARAMAATTIALPLAMCAKPPQMDRVIAELERALPYDNWQSSPWIEGQLALVLDAGGHVHVAGFDLTYTDELGLTATKAEGGV